MKINIKNHISPNRYKKAEKDIAMQLLELGYIDCEFYKENYINRLENNNNDDVE